MAVDMIKSRLIFISVSAGRYQRRKHTGSMRSIIGVCICCWASNGTNLSVG